MSLHLIAGPSNSGPGERQQMLDMAAEIFAGVGTDRAEIIRIDVPARGAGEQGAGDLRAELEPLIPALQSGSLFGTGLGVLLVDGHALNSNEAEVVASLIENADLETVTLVILATGALSSRLGTVLKKRGQTVPVKKMYEKQATTWLANEVERRGLTLDKGAESALLQRFGTDTGAMSSALEQLGEHQGRITRDLVLARFKNRPDEPLFHLTDAIAKGDVGVALRRLGDFLAHGHPLVFLAALENDVKRRALAAAAPDEPTFKEWIGSRGRDYRAEKTWRERGRVRESSLRLAQQALVKADRVMKSQPEELHQVTLERMTVALCRWYR